MGDLSDSSPLVSAASSSKLRLVRLLLEGRADVNMCNVRGDTALLAACKALKEEPAGTDTLKVITYLLQNKADPNTQDQSGRTALMYACMQKAALVASTLLSAGADPTTKDHCGASALVYAINAQHEPTLKVIIDACRARGRDIIIIATEARVNEGGSVTKHYLNIPPSPDSSPVSCMSPSDIVIKTSTPNSPEGGNIFNFREGGRRGPNSPDMPRQRGLSEPWLTIPNLTYLNSAYERGLKESDDSAGSHEVKDKATREVRLQRLSPSCYQNPSLSQSLLTLTNISSTTDAERLPPCPTPYSQQRRNTMPSVTVVTPVLHLPPLNSKSNSSYHQNTGQTLPSKSQSMLFLPRPPSSAPPPATKLSVRSALLKPRTLRSSAPSLVVPPASCTSKRFEKFAHRRGQQGN